MNNRKLLLAYIRKADHAHAGETEAIELAMKDTPKDPDQHLLDVGCGLGGTASYLEKHRWGRLSGIDNDEEVINYARLHYPQVYFKQSDVLNISNIFIKQKFDVIYSFNAYFCFESQEDSLKAMSDVANNTSELVLFDYSSPGHYSQNNPFYDANESPSKGKLFNPINLKEIENQMRRTGWILKQTIDLTSQFNRWYQWLTNQMENQKNELIQLFGKNTFDDLYKGYCRLLNLIKQNEIGGVVVRAFRNS